MKLINISLLSLCTLMPIALVAGNFFADLFASLSGLLVIIAIIINKKFYLIKNRIFFFFILLCLIFILSSILSKTPLLSLESSLFYFRFGFYSLAILYCINNFNNFKKYFFISLLFSFLLVIFSGLLQYYLDGYNIFFHYKSNGILVPLEYWGWNRRISGVFGSEYILGSYLSRLLPLIMGLAFILLNKNKINFTSIFIFLILICITIFLSNERSAIFYFFVTISLSLLLIKSWRSITATFFLFSALLFIVLIFINNNFYNRVITSTFQQLGYNKVDNNLPNLIGYYLTAYEIYKDNKIIGIGPKNYRIICKEYEIDSHTIFPLNDKEVSSQENQIIAERNFKSFCNTHPHNIYMQLLSETGLIGALPVLICFLFVIKKFCFQLIYIFIKKKKYMSDFETFCYIGIFIFLWPLIPTGSFFNNWLSVITFTLVGFLLSSSENFKKHELL